MKRVLIVGPFDVPGNRNVCEDLADQLAGAGWQVTRTSSFVIRPLRVVDMLLTAWRRRHHYDVAQIDVFSFNAFRWAEAMGMLLRRIGKPYILTLHGGSLPDFAQENAHRVRKLFAGAAHITAPSNFLREKMQPYSTRIELLPNAIDLGNYPYQHRQKPAHKLVWLRAFRGGADQGYNPLLAIKMVARLKDEFPDLHLTMVGPDSGDGTFQAVQRCIKDMELQQQITLRGGVPKSEVPAMLNQGDILINTPNVDNTPVSVIEGLACGLCVVSTNVGGLPYLLRDEEDSLLVPPDDPQAMAAAVRRMLCEPELAGYLSDNARRKAESFGWDSVLARWEHILMDAVKGI